MPEVSKSTKQYRYYDFIMVSFVTILLCSNLISASKVARVGEFSFGAGVIFFPISYIFGDVLTEVYGYARARRVVWAGFSATIFASLVSFVVVNLPADPNWPHQNAWQTVFGATPRIVFASVVAFFIGEFSNSFVLAKMKVWTRGRFLWLRTIGSTLIGEGVDSLVFYPLAFYEIWDMSLIVKVLISNYLLKVGCEVLMTPVTYRVVSFLKKNENEDFYDVATDFNPFTIKT